MILEPIANSGGAQDLKPDLPRNTYLNREIGQIAPKPYLDSVSSRKAKL